MSRAHVVLAASFVVTVAGCGAGDRQTSPPSLFQDGDGNCRYMHGSSCPEGASCNPPPPLAAECTAELRDGGAPKGPVREGKVRILEQLWVNRGDCTFASDYFCAIPPARGCDTREQKKISCRELSPGPGAPFIHHVESFIGKRADGSCTRFPAFTCEGDCELPAGEAVSCEVPAPAPSFAVEGDAPTPFSAEQIRAATKVGRRYAWRVEEEGKPPATRVIVFTSVDEEGAVMVAGPDDASLAASSPSRARWDELQKHALFPAAATSVQDERVTVPAGTFDCRVYTVKDADGTVRRFYFALDLPGAPVLHFTEKDGRRLSTSTLVEHTQAP